MRATSRGRWTIATALVVASVASPAFAVDVQLAKKCRDLAIKAHPPAVAGSKTGTAQAERDFYRTCIDHNGKVDDDDRNNKKPN
jgi:hypothetical protein